MRETRFIVLTVAACVLTTFFVAAEERPEGKAPVFVEAGTFLTPPPIDESDSETEDENEDDKPPPVPTFVESEEEIREREEIAAFLADIPLRLDFPEGDLKTYLIDPATGDVIRNFEGSLKNYRPDLGILLTEAQRTIYNINGKETDTLPEKYAGKNPASRRETVLTVWKLGTGEKIGEMKSNGDIDDSHSHVANDKVLLYNRQTRKTDVMDAKTGQMLEPLPGHVAYFRTSDAKTTQLILRTGTGKLSLYDPETLRQVLVFSGTDFELSDDDSRIATWSNSLQDVTVYEWDTGQKINSFPTGDEITLNNDGTMLLVRNRSAKEIVLWDVDTGQQLWTAPLGGKSKDYYTFQFSEDRKIVAGNCGLSLPISSDDYPQTFVWNAWNGKQIAVFEFFSMKNYIPETNRIFGNVKLGRFQSNDALCNATTGEIIAEKFTGSFVEASRDGKIFLTSDEGTLFLWDSETGSLIRSLRNENIVPYVSNVTFDSNPAWIRTTTHISRLDSCFVAQQTLIDIETGGVVHHRNILPWNRENDIVWKTDDENAVFWNLETGEAFLHIQIMMSAESPFAPNRIGSIHFTPNGQLIYSTDIAPWHARAIF